MCPGTSNPVLFAEVARLIFSYMLSKDRQCYACFSMTKKKKKKGGFAPDQDPFTVLISRVKSLQKRAEWVCLDLDGEKKAPE